MRHVTTALAIAAMCAALPPTAVWAQPDDSDDGSDDGDEEVEFAPDEIGDEFDVGSMKDPAPEGSEENPDAPPEFGERRDDGTRALRRVRTGYPIEEALRPITLAEGMSEITIDVLSNVDAYFSTALIEARYGITRQAQLGLGYGPGAVDSDGFTAGKAVSIDVHYLLADWLAVQVELPILLDPFSMGLTLGAPLRFRFGERFALIGGHDLVHIALRRFVPAVGDPLFNEAQVAIDEVDTILDSGELRLLGGAIYQLKPNLALLAELGLLARDFAITDAGVPLLATLTYSVSNKFDLGARIGFRDLGDADETFGATLQLALRI
ncbi:MAG: hypothetical protein AAGC55_11575 [Myxococcota bacterium]